MSTDRSPRLTVVFVDGLGVGRPDPAWNPLARSGAEFLTVFQNRDEPVEMPLGGIAKGLDAQLGVPGLPQSATNQTSLLTGVNGPRVAGGHLSGFPNTRLREIIFEHSLLRCLRQVGFRTAFVNAYVSILDKPFSTLVRYISATTMACMSSGQPFLNLEDLRAQRAVYQEFTNRDLVKRGYRVPIWEPEDAGRILAHLSAEYHLCLYEYFRTDRAGHSMDPVWAGEVVGVLNRFIRSLLENVDFSAQTVLLVSDHGNVEDLSCRTHTTNPAVAAVWGLHGRELLDRLKTVCDVTPSVFKHFGVPTLRDDRRNYLRVSQFSS